MRNIAYIELDTHAEIALNFWTLSQQFQSVKLDFYLSEKIIGNFHNVSKKDIIKSNEKTILEQLAHKKYDAIILGTCHRYFETYLEICKKYPTALLVHNLNFIQQSPWQLLNKVGKKDKIYRLKLLLKEGLLSAPQIYHEAEKLWVLDENLLTITSKFKKKTESISIFYTENSYSSTREKIKVVIPGAVSQNRRNYEHVFSKIANFQHPMEIVFLGKAQGKELKQIEQLEKVIPKNIQLRYFDHKVAQELFDSEINSATLLWCPLQEKNNFFSQEEIYGKTKMSGNLGDAIKYGKPAIFPSSYPSLYPFILKEENDVEQQIIGLQNFDYDFSKEFSVEKMAKKLEQILENW